MATNLIFFFAALAFGALIGGRAARGERREQLLFIGTNLAMLTIGLILGVWLSV